MTNVLETSLKAIDEYLRNVSDEEFLKTYEEVEQHQGMLVVEFLEHHTATPLLSG